MSVVSSNNKRIAKNTIFLYFRMLLMMVVSLYTSRVVLNTLGITDYGVHNVVGGLVSMFSLISGSMNTTISRFLTFELGREDTERLRIVFSTSVNIQLGIAIAIVLLAEVAGLWFLNFKMVIPEGRMVAANWVFQCSLLSFCVNIVSVPYNAVIIAHEKMDAYAYFGIIEALLKLLIVFLLPYSSWDKLIYYAILLLAVSLIMRFSYGWYCNRNFKESKYYFVFEKSVLKEMGSFAGWNYLGAIAAILRTQGLSLLLNLYFGVAVNAARGVTAQVEAAVTQFVANFTMALNPQITKSFAREDRGYMHLLVCYGAKYSFFMMLILIIPLIIEAPIILKLWLKIVPDFAVIFLRITLIVVLLDTLSDTLTMSMQASGNIKLFQIIVSSIVLMVFPVSYLLFGMGFPPYSCYIVCAIAMVLKLVAELPLLKKMVGLPPTLYISVVLKRALLVSVLLFSLPLAIAYYFEDSTFRFIFVTAVSLLWSVPVIFFAGLSISERKSLLSKAKSMFSKKQN